MRRGPAEILEEALTRIRNRVAAQRVVKAPLRLTVHFDFNPAGELRRCEIERLDKEVVAAES